MPYTNPVIPGFYPDPSVCRVGSDYYLVTSTFEFFPGVPVFHSHDLVHWRQIGHCLTRPSQLPLENASPVGAPSGGIYAPTIRHHNGLFYMITTNVSQGGHFYVTATDPAGEWSEPVWLNTFAIDPSLFFDDDGTIYFTHNGPNGIYQSTLDPATGKPTSEPRHIWAGTGGAYPEAPHLYKINGRYYLMIAEGGTEYGHMETIARSNSPWGPWESCPFNPILSNRSRVSTIQGTGHADLFQDHLGNWWVVFLAFRPPSYPYFHNLGRETCLAPVTWTADGWPVVNEGKVITLEMDGPLPPSQPWPAGSPRDDFDTSTLALCWNYLRSPIPAHCTLTERPGWLRLKSAPTRLDEVTSPSWLGRRQQHLSCRAAARLEFAPQQDGEEAGLTAYMDPTHHYEIAITRRNGQRQVIVRRQIGRLSAVVAAQPIADGPITLEIRAEPQWYHFACTTPTGERIEMPQASGESRYLSTEVAGGFTGVYFAMYAVGSGSPADFDWFDYLPEL